MVNLNRMQNSSALSRSSAHILKGRLRESLLSAQKGNDNTVTLEFRHRDTQVSSGCYLNEPGGAHISAELQ